jgi:alkylation response protein AidB-like acyl-CoA dehydrogenase
MVYRTAEAIDAGEDGRSATRELYGGLCVRDENRVADRAVQIWRPRLHARRRNGRFYRELRVERIWEGASEIQRLIIANGLLKRGQAPLVE